MKIIALALFAALPALAQAADPDAVFQAMTAEMKRAKERLQLENEKRPYYIEYTLQDSDTYSADSVMGAPRSEVRFRNRLVRVLVRVGDYKLDNSFPQSPVAGAIELTVLDDDVLALRHHLWLATDRAYKSALQQYSAKQAALKQFESVTPIDDFAKAEPHTDLQPLASITAPVTAWPQILQKLTALGRAQADIQSCSANARATATNRYFLNSEGATTRRGQLIAEMRMDVETQAPDGMRLELTENHTWAAPNEIAPEAELVAEAKALIAKLLALRQAPLVEEQYRGPVLFSADAASTITNTMIAENVLGKRPRLGQTARVRGTFANEWKSRVLPEDISVIDDPTQQSAAGRTLAGYYRTDDEGVKAEAVTVVDKGVLVSYLLSRTPIRDFPRSNGHGRLSLSQAVEPRVGNLFLRSSRGLPDAGLKTKFLDACKQQSKEYCYRVESLGRVTRPRLLYRVYANDGREELVRGAIIDGLDTRALRNEITGVGATMEVSNISGPSPYSIVTPPLLFNELEVKNENAGKEKLPDYPRPAAQ